jgi:two-component system, NarL family, sensor histidine kinase DevS
MRRTSVPSAPVSPPSNALDIRATIFALQARDHADAQPDIRGTIVALVEQMTPILGFAPSLRLGAGLRIEVAGDVAEQVLAVLREALSWSGRGVPGASPG